MPQPELRQHPVQYQAYTGTISHQEPTNETRAPPTFYRADPDQLDQFFLRNGRSIYFPQWPVTEEDDLASMICLKETLAPDHVTVSENMSSTCFAHIIGLPIVKGIALCMHSSNMCYTFAATSQQITLRKGIRHVNIPSFNGISLTSDLNGQTMVTVDNNEVADESLIDSEDDQRDVVFMNETQEVGLWHSIDLRQIETKSDVVSFLLDMLPPAERERFCERNENGVNLLSRLCYKGDSETVGAFFSKLSSDQKLNQSMSRIGNMRNWTLLHCAAASSSKTVKVILDNFSTERERWKLLKSKSTDDQTALHVALSLKNVKTAILLLDKAGDKCRNLLSRQDVAGLTARDYISESPVLDRLMQTFSELNSASLTSLAKKDEDKLIELTLDQLCDTSVEAAASAKDIHGMTAMDVVARCNSSKTLAVFLRLCSPATLVNCITDDKLLHQAVRCKSYDIIDTFIDLLSQEELMQCMRSRLGGNTVLHEAANSNSPSLLHKLLMRIEQPDWVPFIQKTNDHGETVERIGAQHYSVVETLKLHQLFVEKENNVGQFFEALEDNLCNVNMPAERVTCSYKLIKIRNPEELGYRRNVNYDATRCLKYGDFPKANDLISLAMQVDPNCIQALCNKAVYLLKCGGDGCVKDIAVQVLKQYSVDSGEPRLYAKVDFAYWLAEVVRTDEARNRSCQIFERCTEEAVQCAESTVSAYCSYFHVKILVRMLKSKGSRFNDSFETIVKKILLHFCKLAEVDSHEYNGEIYVWIAELQSTKIWHRVEKAMQLEELRDVKERCLTILQCENFHLETCIRKVIDLRELYRYEKKLIMRIGKQCLDVAYQTSLRTRSYWFEQALGFSRESSDNFQDWDFMCFSNSCQALFNLWAIDFYQRNTIAVDKQIRARTGVRPRDENHALRFVIEQYYNSSLLRDNSTRDYLITAKGHLKQLVDKGGWKSHGLKYARVKHLLGDRPQEVEEAFQHALNVIDNQRSGDYANALEYMGRYHEIRGSLDDALHFYDKALSIPRKVRGCAGYIAHTGRESIRYFNPDEYRHYRFQSRQHY